MNRRQLLQRLLSVSAALRLAPASVFAQPTAAKPGVYLFGVSYYPEQWPAPQVPEDFAKMRDLGINLVRMGEFAWSSMQPAPGVFQFDWLDRAVTLAQKNGIAVVLGTPTAGVPPWLYKLHPDVISSNEKGPYTYGGRKGFNLYSPAMHDAAAEVISRLAARYGSNSAVTGWQLSNEPGYPIVNYDHATLLAFRLWLKQRYGTLDKLNASWSGAFWSNQYDAWDEISFPTNSSEGGWNPGIRLDYRRFFSDAFLRWLRFEAKLVRQHAHNQFVYTNWPEVAWSVDIFESAAFLDAAAWDNYNTMPGTGSPFDVIRTGFNHDLCRASQPTQSFFVAEQPTQPSPDTDARAIRLTTWSDVAYGSHATVFFEFRPPVEGSEMAYVSMLEPDGSFGDSTPLLRQTFAEIGRLYPRLAAARTKADIALIYSYDNSWDQGFRVREGPGVGAAYDNVATRFYSGVKSLKRNVDVIPASRDLSPYRMVVAPGLHIVSDDDAARLTQWVEAGGILVIDRKSGTRSPDARLRPLVEPGVFATIAGLHVPGTEGERGSPHTVRFQEGGTSFRVENSSTVNLNGAEALATYQGPALEGHPAVTLHPAGKGFVVFVSFTCRQDAFFDALFAVIARRFAIQPIVAAPLGVDCVSRATPTTEYIFLINNTQQPATIDLPAPMTELITNQPAPSRLTLAGLQLAVLERPLTS